MQSNINDKGYMSQVNLFIYLDLKVTLWSFSTMEQFFHKRVPNLFLLEIHVGDAIHSPAGNRRQ